MARKINHHHQEKVEMSLNNENINEYVWLSASTSLGSSVPIYYYKWASLTTPVSQRHANWELRLCRDEGYINPKCKPPRH